MPFRRTKGIVTDSDLSDPKKEADVIMTAAALGFAASYVKNGTPIRFDIDPKYRQMYRVPCLGGVQILDDAHIVDDHKAARDGLRSYLSSNSSDKTVAATLVLDAVTVHESESVRIDRTLK